ncbi:MAG: hypothetical protein A4E30_00293 [Methanomassiliicoccales archaeon PtaB.Bin215]|nr:MAG: hypothetical protein A4E30_00293 [Methanomassiliicoccales archaeon PtaB.Bin215]
MGGYSFQIAESTNYQWYLHLSLGGSFPTYRFQVMRKSDNQYIDFREMSEDDSEEYAEFDRASRELEEELKNRGAFEALTSENLTLSMLYKRMVKAEDSQRHWRRMYEDLDETFTALENAWHKIAEEKRKAGR